MKKALILICALVLCLLASSGLSDSYGTAIVYGRNSTKVHLREEATYKSASRGLFFTGTEVDLRSDPDEKWVKVRMGGLSGYMSSDYLLRGYGRKNPGTAFQSGTVTATNYAYFRNGPSTEHMVLGRIDEGEQVTVMGETSEHWYYIKYRNECGYISGNLVRLTGAADAADSSDGLHDAYDRFAELHGSAAETEKTASSLPRDLPASWLHASGAGAWGTELYLMESGFFHGYFHDSEASMVYESHFSGLFTDIKRRDAYSYTMKLSNFHVFGTMGEAQVKNGILYITQEPAGLEKGDTFVLYLPGTPMNRISQEERSWTMGNTGNTLQTYLLSNQDSGRGFVPDSLWK